MLVGNVPCLNGCCIGLVKEENGKGEGEEGEKGRISLEGKKYIKEKKTERGGGETHRRPVPSGSDNNINSLPSFSP